ncbi:MAG TPA: glycosyltransferase family 2 protein, partial [Friedmanniella sp.]
IVKDEEAVLDGCLASVAWADEIVVYDTGSTDATREIARRHTDVVVEGYWDDDFGGARNRAMAHATGEWVLSIDADEVFEGDPDRMRELLGRGDVSAHTVTQRNSLGDVRLPLQLERLSQDSAITRVFRREVTRWEGVLHEQPVDVRGGSLSAVSALPNVVLAHTGYLTEVSEGKHKTERNLALAVAQVEQGIAEGIDPEALEPRRVHLARALISDERHAEALEVADALLRDGFVRSTYAVILAKAVVVAALVTEDVRAQHRWLDVWEQHDTNPAFSLAMRARFAAVRGDARETLAALERIPTTVVNGLGLRMDRTELVVVEVWAHSATGDVRRAAQVARDAARQGVAAGAPAGLVALLGHDHALPVIGALPERLWREYVTWCAMDVTAESRTFLRWMHEVRPGDAAVLGAAALLAPAMSLDEAAGWAADVRRAGDARACPLVSISADPLLDPRQRALAGALAYSAYGDERGLAGLSDALCLVDPADEVELAAELEIVAPGLVGAPA